MVAPSPLTEVLRDTIDAILADGRAGERFELKINVCLFEDTGIGSPVHRESIEESADGCAQAAEEAVQSLRLLGPEGMLDRIQTTFDLSAQLEKAFLQDPIIFRIAGSEGTDEWQDFMINLRSHCFACDGRTSHGEVP
ncbi:MAG: hypothetical protein PHX87_01830 [Candidatus Peribacteraceae bacterium]|nr:hypothetical protein [Candidatus Peribacteraceae bacterium]MDD5742146.1 hypothetical protein [Candidatus Peribacteraceae bacterium]